MKRVFALSVLKLAVILLVVTITVGCSRCVQCLPALGFGEKLFPLSYYGQSVEICMRILADSRHQHDQETATDLCVGRLLRLSDSVIQMERVHATKKPYLSEDIIYILGLMGAVAEERKQELESSKVAVSMVNAIESRLARLLRYP